VPQPQWVVRYEVDCVEVDYATQQPEHEEVDQSEFQNCAEERKACLPEFPNRRMDRKKNRYQGKGKKDLSFGEIGHWKGVMPRRFICGITLVWIVT